VGAFAILVCANRLRLCEEDLAECFKDKQRMTYDSFSRLSMAASKALRISVGLVTNFADVYRFLQFAQAFVDKMA